MPVRLDHAVINVLTAMDAAADRFRALGFQTTDRGYHSLGSINHLMVFGNDYLELVGIEPGASKVRAEVATSPIGLNGLVFATDDARALQRRLSDRGVPVGDPLDFSRPVQVDGAEHLARFTTVRVRPDFVCGGRVYFCEHKTPELVWHAPWLQHPNTACGLAEFVLVTDDPAEQARRYALLLDGAQFSGAGQEGMHQGGHDGRSVGSDDGTCDGLFNVLLGDCRLSLMTPALYAARYREAGCSQALVQPLPGGGCMGALSIRVASLDALRARLAQATDAPAVIDTGDTLLVAAHALWDCPLAFVADTAAQADGPGRRIRPPHLA